MMLVGESMVRSYLKQIAALEAKNAELLAKVQRYYAEVDGHILRALEAEAKVARVEALANHMEAEGGDDRGWVAAIIGDVRAALRPQPSGEGED